MPWQSFTLDEECHVIIAGTEFLEQNFSSISDNLNFECRRKVRIDLSPIRQNDNAHGNM